MKKTLLVLIVFALTAAASPSPHWRPGQISLLETWLDEAKDQGLAAVAAEQDRMRAARASHDDAALDATATAAAVHLLKALRTGCCQSAPPAYWQIAAGTPWPDAIAAVASAVDDNRLDALFRSAQPAHPYFLALARAYAAEKDPQRRSIIAANLDRWRWMPRAPGNRYLLVNAAAFEATLWENGSRVGRWQVIVGKTKSPTPVFAADVQGVIFNPWWEIPKSIVAESIGKLVRDHPDVAAQKGYVVENGRYRQAPGPQNSLGQMKLVMPNPYSIYLHDTPAQSLFEKPVRAFSHGCVRVDDALGLAVALLQGQEGWNRARVDGVIASRQTVTVPLDQPIPVYVAYFTAEADDMGGVRYFPDIYKRDPAPVQGQGGVACTSS